MAWITIFGLALLFSSSVRGDLVSAALKDTVKLSPLVTCSEGGGSLIRRLKDNSAVSVASSANGVLKPVGEEYASRLDISSSGVFLKDVNYNDNGHYEFLCDDNIERIIQLEVLFMPDLSTTEGGRETLPCFSSTLGEPAELFQWETNGELVMRVEDSGKVVEFGERFKERVFLSRDWELRGDLSLTLERVQLQDRGDYYCYVQKGSKGRGDPAAVRLNVLPNIKTSTAPPQRTLSPSAQKESLHIGITIVGVLVVSAPCFIWIGWYLRSRRSDSSSVDVEKCLHVRRGGKEERPAKVSTDQLLS